MADDENWREFDAGASEFLSWLKGFLMGIAATLVGLFIAFSGQ